MLALAVLLVAMVLSGCVNVLTNREVLAEGSWYGRVVDGQGRGVANATVTLHVLNDHGEVYRRQAQAASPDTVKGIYTFDHIELRGGADRAYTTCNATADNGARSAVGKIRALTDHASASTMTVDGKSISVLTYDGVVDEELVLE